MTDLAAAPSFAEAAATHARLRPDDPAVLDGGVRWSWAELDRRATAIAAALEAAGIAPGDRVGIRAVSSAGVVAAIHGMVRTGVVAVPIGPRLTEPETEAIAAAADLAAFVTPDGAVRPIDGPGRAASFGAPAVIIATSGTTGRPRLVRLAAARLDASAAAWSAVLPPQTGWLLSLNLAHVSGIGIVVRAARAGVPVVVPRSADDEPILAGLAAARSAGIAVSHISLVPPQLAGLLDAGAPPPPELRAVLLGGGPIPESLVSRAIAAGWPIVPSYGLSETASGIVAVPLGEASNRPWSAGRPMPGVELRIGPGTAPGGVGEIMVRGPMVFDGYENDPAATAAALDADGWLRTGDLGSLDADGWLRVAGRADETIVSGGENVAPAEIEAVLGAHPAVADAAVVGVPDEKWGAVPVAIVVFRPGAAPTEEELRAFARERLAPFKVPARVVEVALDSAVGVRQASAPLAAGSDRRGRPPPLVRPGCPGSRPATASASPSAIWTGRRGGRRSSSSTAPSRPRASCSDWPSGSRRMPAPCCRTGGGAAAAPWPCRRRFRSPAMSPTCWPSWTPPASTARSSSATASEPSWLSSSRPAIPIGSPPWWPTSRRIWRSPNRRSGRGSAPSARPSLPHTPPAGPRPQPGSSSGS